MTRHFQIIFLIWLARGRFLGVRSEDPKGSSPLFKPLIPGFESTLYLDFMNIKIGFRFFRNPIFLKLKIMHKPIAFFAAVVFLLLAYCKTDDNTSIVKVADLEAFFAATNTPLIEKNREELAFWQKKYEASPKQHPYLMRMAGIYGQLFHATGDESFLLKADSVLNIVYEHLGVQSATVLRALAHNHMNLHQFDQALLFAEKAKTLKAQEVITDLLLYDLYSETGREEKAIPVLQKYPQKQNFAYLVRQAKQLDNEGELAAAVAQMERASRAAAANKDAASLAWSFNMLGDFQGHAGNFAESYSYFKRALTINPLDAFAAQKIISILINVDQNIDLADRMLKKLMQNNQSLSLHLLAAEIADDRGEEQLKREYMQHFIDKVADSPFRIMYRSHLFYLYNDELDRTEKARELALEEVQLRPTTGSYDLLMWSALKANKIEEAQFIATQFLIGASEEPIVLYHLHELFKKTGAKKEATKIKKELASADLELGRDIMEELFGYRGGAR